MLIFPTGFKGKRHEYTLDPSPRIKSKAGAPVIDQIEFNIAASSDELVLALGRVTANEIDPRYAAELFLVRDEDG